MNQTGLQIASMGLGRWNPTIYGYDDPISVTGEYALEVYVLGYGYSRNESAEPSQAPQRLSPSGHVT